MLAKVLLKLENMKVEYVVEDILLKGGLTVFYGNSGTRKSFLLFDMAMAIASGKKWATKFNTIQSNVMWIDRENDKVITKERLKSLIAGSGYSESELLDNNALFYEPFYSMNLSDKESTRTSILKLKEYVESNKIKVVFIDNLTSVLAFTDQRESKLSGGLQALKDFAHTANITVIVIHHGNKDNPENYRGTGTIENICDALIFVDTDDTSGECKNMLTTPRKIRHKPVNQILRFEYETNTKHELTSAKFIATDEVIDNKNDKQIFAITLERAIYIIDRNETITKTELYEDLMSYAKISRNKATKLLSKFIQDEYISTKKLVRNTHVLILTDKGKDALMNISVAMPEDIDLLMNLPQKVKS